MPNHYRTKSLLPPSNLATNQTANLQCLLQYPRCAAFVCSMVEQTTPRCVLCLLQCRTDWEEFFWSPDRIVVATRAKRTVSGGVVHIDIYHIADWKMVESSSRRESARLSRLWLVCWCVQISAKTRNNMYSPHPHHHPGHFLVHATTTRCWTHVDRRTDWFVTPVVKACATVVVCVRWCGGVVVEWCLDVGKGPILTAVPNNLETMITAVAQWPTLRVDWT